MGNGPDGILMLAEQTRDLYGRSSVCALAWLGSWPVPSPQLETELG